LTAEEDAFLASAHPHPEEITWYDDREGDC
jgi:hypothetical protein